jgi:hypothetical protein
VLQKTVVKPTTASAARVAVTACAYNSDGRMMAAGLLDGTVQVRGWRVCFRFCFLYAPLRVPAIPLCDSKAMVAIHKEAGGMPLRMWRF